MAAEHARVGDEKGDRFAAHRAAAVGAHGQPVAGDLVPRIELFLVRTLIYARPTGFIAVRLTMSREQRKEVNQTCIG